MTRKSVLLTIFALYLGIAGITLAWTASIWTASDPNVTLAVKGASISESSPSAAETALADYPVFNEKKAAPIYAKQYVLYHQESGKVIYRSKNLDPVPIASTTKAMTAHIITQIGRLTDIVTISPEAAAMIGSRMGLYAGQEFTVEKLLYGAMLVSGNDSARALAEYGGGILLKDAEATPDQKVERFVKEMNAVAGSLHLSDTRYLDPVGLDDGGRSTALDLAKLTGSINEDPILSRIIGTATITLYDEDQRNRFDLKNSNRLIAEYDYSGSLGGKTGFTPDAGHCLISSAKRDGHTLTAVILHTDEFTNEASAVEARRLLDLGFALTTWK